MKNILDDLEADRQIMSDLMDSLDKQAFGDCPVCKEYGIILTANADDKDKTGHTRAIKGCWVCVKNKKVVNPTGLGFS